MLVGRVIPDDVCVNGGVVITNANLDLKVRYMNNGAEDIR